MWSDARIPWASVWRATASPWHHHRCRVNRRVCGFDLLWYAVGWHSTLLLGPVGTRSHMNLRSLASVSAVLNAALRCV